MHILLNYFVYRISL